MYTTCSGQSLGRYLQDTLKSLPPNLRTGKANTILDIPEWRSDEKILGIRRVRNIENEKLHVLEVAVGREGDWAQGRGI